MLEANEQRSKIARLRAHIADEYKAAERGLTGIRSGSARHDFILKHMDAMTESWNQLGEIVGPDIAMAMLSETLDELPSSENMSTTCP